MSETYWREPPVPDSNPTRKENDMPREVKAVLLECVGRVLYFPNQAIELEIDEARTIGLALLDAANKAQLLEQRAEQHRYCEEQTRLNAQSAKGVDHPQTGALIQ